MHVYPDLAVNEPLRNSVIKIIEIIVSIENENVQGEKPILNELKRFLVKLNTRIFSVQYSKRPTLENRIK